MNICSQEKIDRIPKIILACAILHNISLLMEDDWDEDDQLDGEDEDEDEDIHPRNIRAETIRNHICEFLS